MAHFGLLLLLMIEDEVSIVVGETTQEFKLSLLQQG
jgi:hypothetical protein